MDRNNTDEKLDFLFLMYYNSSILKEEIKMSVISLRLNEKEEKLLKEVSDFEGVGISSYIKKIIFEKLEDEYDIKLADKAYKNYIDSGMKTTSFDDLVKELGFDEVDGL